MLVISAKGRELEAALKEARLPERSHRMLMSRACLNFQAGGGPSTLVEAAEGCEGPRHCRQGRDRFDSR